MTPPRGGGRGKPSGSGGFKFVSWQKDDRLVVDRFPDNWQTGDDGQALPYLDQMVFRELVDEPTVIAEMRAGTTRSIPPSSYLAV